MFSIEAHVPSTLFNRKPIARPFTVQRTSESGVDEELAARLIFVVDLICQTLSLELGHDPSELCEI
jgi:hypothetical protein